MIIIIYLKLYNYLPKKVWYEITQHGLTCRQTNQATIFKALINVQENEFSRVEFVGL